MSDGVRPILRRVAEADVPPSLYTLANLRPAQIRGMVDRHLRHALVPRLPVDVDAGYERRVPEDLTVTSEPIATDTARLREALSPATRAAYRDHTESLRRGRLAIAERTLVFDPERPFEWDETAVDSFPLYWRLHLQGLRPVERFVLGYDDVDDAPGAAVESVVRFVEGWLATTTVGGPNYLRRDWIPHSVSLRLVALCRFYALAERRLDPSLARRVRRAVHKNAAFLANHVEFDVGGNHLAENALALVVAGTFFGDGGEEWVERGCEVFDHVATTQFLDDGGHYERSPMYHVQVLCRSLTAVGVLASGGRTPPPSLRETATAALEYLRSLSPPDGRLPLLNDAVYGETPTVEECERYASAVGVPSSARTTWRLGSSGYYWVGDGASRLLLDAGPVGPPHLPGHSHNDLLSVCLWVDGEPVFTDTGTPTYEASTDRRYARSVRAHNTVQVGDYEPIAVGGQYTLGRRTEPRVRCSESGVVRDVEAWYRKSSPFGTLYHHRRRVVGTDGWWLVLDAVDSRYDLPVTSRLHAHPDVVVRAGGPDEPVDIGRDGVTVASVTPLGAERVTVGSRPWYPRFGVTEYRPVLEFVADADAAVTGFLVATAALGDVTVSRSANRLTVTADGRRYAVETRA